MSGTITQDLLLTSNSLYELVGKVVIGGDNEAPAMLTIQAGATVYGGTDVDFLVISRGSQIVANGTRTAPVTFTSQSDLEGAVDPATTRGEWGGLVINGNAPINDCPEEREAARPTARRKAKPTRASSAVPIRVTPAAS